MPEAEHHELPPEIAAQLAESATQEPVELDLDAMTARRDALLAEAE